MDEQKYFLDITADVCPMTFVKTKLLLERMPAGAVVTIRLKGREPLGNVPRSVTAHGHEVLSLVAEDASSAASSAITSAANYGPHLLTIRRK